MNQLTTNSSTKILKYSNTLLNTGTLEVFLDCVLLIIDDYRKYLKYDQTSNEFKFDENIYFQMKNVNNINNELKKNEFYHEFRTTQAFEEFRRDRSDYLKREYEYNNNNNNNNNANNTNIEYPNKDFIESLLDKFKEDQKSTSSRLFNRSKKTFNNVVDKARDKLNRLTLQSSSSSTSQSTGSSINTALSLVPSAFNDFIKDNDSISSESSSSSSTISASHTLNNNNDEKIKEQIRQYAIESQINLDKPYSRLTIDLTNDPEIKKYFENKVEEKEEEKLIDFSEPTPTPPPPPPTSYNSNISNIKSFDVLNPIRLDVKKTNKNTYDSIINEFDPILNNEMKVEPLPNYVKLEENKPNYNIHMMPTSLPNSMSFNTGNTYYQQQQQQQQLQHHFPSASETIARINAINRSASSPINKSLIKK